MFVAVKWCLRTFSADIGGLFFVISTGLQEFVANKVSFKIVACKWKLPSKLHGLTVGEINGYNGYSN